MPSKGLRKKEDLLLGGGCGRSGRKDPGVGLAGSRPLVSGGSVRLSGPEGQRLFPPAVSSLLLSNTIMRGPCPQPSYLQTINGRGRKSRVSGGLPLCWWAQCASLPQGAKPVAPIWILSDEVGRHHRVNKSRSDKSAKIVWLTGRFPAVVTSKENKPTPPPPTPGRSGDGSGVYCHYHS